MHADRLSVRLSEDAKGLIDRAARLSGLTTSAFVTATLVGHAREVIARHEQTVLSARDFARLLDLLDAPPAPTDALRRAHDRHRTLLGEDAR
jgi:uncharacterized protein (DUF1778 family)